VLDAIFGAGSRPGSAPDPMVSVRADLRELLDALGAGRDTLGALVGSGRALEPTLTGLAELELEGHIRRVAGGRYVVVPPR
jgi:sirohydrochlorin ferrochelatase